MAENTVRLNRETMDRLASVENDGATLVFTPATKQSSANQEIRTGQVLLHDPDRKSPDGMAVVVTGVRFQEGKTYADVRPATICDVIKDGTIESTNQALPQQTQDVPSKWEVIKALATGDDKQWENEPEFFRPRDIDVEPWKLLQTAAQIGSAEAFLSGSNLFGFGDGLAGLPGWSAMESWKPKSTGIDYMWGSGNTSFKITGEGKFDPRVQVTQREFFYHYKLVISDHLPQYLEFVTYYKHHVKVTVEAEGELIGEGRFKLGPTWHSPPIVMMLGTIPISVAWINVPLLLSTTVKVAGGISSTLFDKDQAQGMKFIWDWNANPKIESGFFDPLGGESETPETTKGKDLEPKEKAEAEESFCPISEKEKEEETDVEKKKNDFATIVGENEWLLSLTGSLRLRPAFILDGINILQLQAEYGTAAVANLDKDPWLRLQPFFDLSAKFQLKVEAHSFLKLLGLDSGAAEHQSEESESDSPWFASQPVDFSEYEEATKGHKGEFSEWGKELVLWSKTFHVWNTVWGDSGPYYAPIETIPASPKIGKPFTVQQKINNPFKPLGSTIEGPDYFEVCGCVQSAENETPGSEGPAKVIADPQKDPDNPKQWILKLRAGEKSAPCTMEIIRKGEEHHLNKRNTVNVSVGDTSVEFDIK